jgi:hypothetical protein
MRLMSPRVLSRALLWLVVLQGFHFFEHCVQLVQQFWLNDPNGNGLLGNLANFEVVHFGYNTLFLAGLVWLYVELSLAAWPAWAHHRLVMGLVAGAVAVQGYHEMEHVLRLLQVLGYVPVPPSADLVSGEPPGLIGRWVNSLVAHWALNGIVEALPLAAFFVGGFARLLHGRAVRRQAVA